MKKKIGGGVLVFVLISGLVSGLVSGLIGGGLTARQMGEGRNFLFTVAVDRYRCWPALSGPVMETRRVKDAMLDCLPIDAVKELHNEGAGKDAIREFLVSLQKGGENELSENDSLIIYFSGHGQAFEAEPGNGYWIPHDGGYDMTARSHWLGNDELRGLLRNIKARHILIIADCCFGGTLVEAEAGGGMATQENAVCRKVLTSGGIERVPGESVFAEQLVDALYRNRLDRLPVSRLHARITGKVHGLTGNRPQYGNLKYSGNYAGAPFILYAGPGTF